MSCPNINSRHTSPQKYSMMGCNQFKIIPYNEHVYTSNASVSWYHIYLTWLWCLCVIRLMYELSNEPHVSTVKLRVSNASSIHLCCILLVSPVQSATYGSCSPDPFQPFYVYCTRHRWYCTRRHKNGVRLPPMNTLPNHFGPHKYVSRCTALSIFVHIPGLGWIFSILNVRQHSNMF